MNTSKFARVCGECSEVKYTMYYDIFSDRWEASAFCYRGENSIVGVRPVGIKDVCKGYPYPGFRIDEGEIEAKVRKSFSNGIKMGTFGLGLDVPLASLSKEERNGCLEGLDDLKWEG